MYKVITILGTISKTTKKPIYNFSKDLSKTYKLKKHSYTNMFTLLIDNFSDVLAIYTKKAKDIQEEVLKDEELMYKFNSDFYIKDENDLDMAFKVINEAIDKVDDEFIIDLSHGFRHLPILAIISLLSQNIQNPTRIKNIFFAKEIIKFKEYEIIDLKELLDIANLSFILENFNQNYTITKIEFSNPIYNILADGLENLSHNILSNGIQNLYKENLLLETKNTLLQISKNKYFDCFKVNMDNTISYIDYLLSLEKELIYIRLLKISKDFAQKGYMLNAITCLYEAAGYYSVAIIRHSSKEVSNNLYKFISKKSKNTNYLVTNFCMSFIKNCSANRGNKNINKVLSSDFDRQIKNYLKNLKNYKNIQNLYKDLDKLRNNLAHANSGDIIKNPHKKYENLSAKFEELILENKNV